MPEGDADDALPSFQSAGWLILFLLDLSANRDRSQVRGIHGARPIHLDRYHRGPKGRAMARLYGLPGRHDCAERLSLKPVTPNTNDQNRF